jgi:NAD(P)H-quinone oxidoreductase subunit 5
MSALSLLPILLHLAAAAVAAAGPEKRPARPLAAVKVLALLALVAAVANVVLFALDGPQTVGLGDGLALLALRIDLPSAAMALLVAFIGWVVTRYSATYLDGEPRQGSFTAAMSLTLAAVLTLVTAGSLLVFLIAFVGTSLSLHRLLVFYGERDAARRAARKKFILSRLADLALLVAALVLWNAYGTADIGLILERARSGSAPAGSELAAAFLALAAILKSAQFPFHGWLTEVMETPTPVSALLHAGVVNAGGFLLIRFADVMILSPLTLAALTVVGAFTALFGSLVMLTQSAVKTSLAWSTVAQMGFMILQCGLALFPIALLHILAHSLYKAHSFLSSGNAVESVRAARRLGPVAAPGLGAVLRAFLLALAVYAAVGFLFGFWEKPPQALALGAILIFGVAYLFAQGLADAAPWPLTIRVSVFAGAAAVGYFGLQWLAYRVSEGALPQAPAAGPIEWALIVLALASFALVAFAQALLPVWATHPAAVPFRVHLQNGFYLNAIFDRALGHFRLGSARAHQGDAA